MKRLLRGIIDFGSLTSDELLGNYNRLSLSRIKWVDPVDEKLYRFTKDFYETEGAFPSATVLADYFQRADDYEALERLKDLKTAPVLKKNDYSFVLRNLIEDQKKAELTSLMKAAHEIATKGMTFGEGFRKVKKEGIPDAVRHLEDGLGSVTEGIMIPPVVVTDQREATRDTLAAYSEQRLTPIPHGGSSRVSSRLTPSSRGSRLANSGPTQLLRANSSPLSRKMSPTTP